MVLEFLGQPTDGLFGAELDLLQKAEITRFEFAVAWLRLRGLQRIQPAMDQLIGRGGCLRATIGIDRLGTSEEALQGLLDLESKSSRGQVETYVYHDEGTQAIFHPKVFLLLGKDDARLIVGSNNLTLAALEDNIEARVSYVGLVKDPVVLSARKTLAAWRSPSQFVKRLTPTFLRELTSNGYVLDEAATRTRMAVAQSAVQKQRRKLFGTTTRRRGFTTGATGTPQSGRAVLLLRPRIARRTQAQIPTRVVSSPMFKGVGEIISDSGVRHRISSASARGKINTWKVELPETAVMIAPVLRIWSTPAGMRYSIFESSTPEGLVIAAALQAGLMANPPTTVATRGDLNRATLYRFL